MGVSVLKNCHLTLLHSGRPKMYTILAFLSAIGLTGKSFHGPKLCITALLRCHCKRKCMNISINVFNASTDPSAEISNHYLNQQFNSPNDNF